MRSALVAVKGVTRADVLLEGHEAHIEYDATQCRIETLLATVASVKIPGMPVFSATVKPSP